jgi:hypothetical protein
MWSLLATDRFLEPDHEVTTLEQSGSDGRASDLTFPNMGTERERTTSLDPQYDAP